MHDQSILYWAYKERVQQGRPLNVNHEAACFIEKTEGRVEKGAQCLNVGEKRMNVFFNEWTNVGRSMRLLLLQGGWTPWLIVVLIKILKKHRPNNLNSLIGFM